MFIGRRSVLNIFFLCCNKCLCCRMIRIFPQRRGINTSWLLTLSSRSGVMRDSLFRYFRYVRHLRALSRIRLPSKVYRRNRQHLRIYTLSTSRNLGHKYLFCSSLTGQFSVLYQSSSDAHSAISACREYPKSNNITCQLTCIDLETCFWWFSWHWRNAQSLLMDV